MVDDLCPYLGSLDGSDIHASYPSHQNLCYVLEEPQEISLLDQRELCLGPNYVSCWLLAPDGVETPLYSTSTSEARAEYLAPKKAERKGGGRPASRRPRRESKGKGRRRSLLVGAIMGLMVILLCICTCSGGTAVFFSLRGKATTAPKIVHVGESVEEMGWEVMITDYPRLADKVGDAAMQNLYKTPQGVFLIVPIQLKNTDDVRKRGWAYTAYKIIDETGEKFEADLDATYAHMTVSNTSRVPSLEPGARWEGELVFDIPADVGPLKLRIEGFDENVLFDLEM